MDGLKAINDNFGHAEGDYAIRELSGYLRATQNDRVGCARIGGDEFLVVVLGGESDTGKVCEYIRRRINRFNNTKNKEYNLSASIGYAEYKPEDGIIACINKADEKMYEEKSRKKTSQK